MAVKVCMGVAHRFVSEGFLIESPPGDCRVRKSPASGVGSGEVRLIQSPFCGGAGPVWEHLVRREPRAFCGCAACAGPV